MESSHRLHDESHGRHCRPLKVVHHTIWVWRGGGWLSVSLWFLVHRYVLVCTDKIPKTCNEDKKHKYLYIWLRKTLLTRTLYILNTKCLPVLDLPIFRFVTLFCEGEFWITWYIFRWRQYNNKVASTPHYEYSPRGEVQNYEISRLEREIRRLAEVRIINPCIDGRDFKTEKKYLGYLRECSFVTCKCNNVNMIESWMDNSFKFNFSILEPETNDTSKCFHCGEWNPKWKNDQPIKSQGLAAPRWKQCSENQQVQLLLCSWSVQSLTLSISKYWLSAWCIDM